MWRSDLAFLVQLIELSIVRAQATWMTERKKSHPIELQESLLFRRICWRIKAGGMGHAFDQMWSWTPG